MAETMAQADNFWLCVDDPTNLMVIHSWDSGLSFPGD